MIHIYVLSMGITLCTTQASERALVSINEHLNQASGRNVLLNLHFKCLKPSKTRVVQLGRPGHVLDNA